MGMSHAYCVDYSWWL